MILDVGCGDAPHGDINVDLLRYTKQTSVQKNLVKTNADLICDGSCLPFRDNSFERVLSYHVIEHTREPLQFLRELLRVSKHNVEIHCPHWLAKGAGYPYHRFKFNRRWFIRVADMLNVSIELRMTYTIHFGFFAQPNEIQALLTKNTSGTPQVETRSNRTS